MKKGNIAFYLALMIFVACIGTVESATFTCNSCTDCTDKIDQAQTGDIVELTADISCDSGSKCIDLSAANDMIFDGGDHVISRGLSGSYGIYSFSSAVNGNTIRNVEIRGFSSGIYFYGGGNNTIEECRLIGNSSGIDLYSSGSNTIQNSFASRNFTGIQVAYNSDNTIIRDSYISDNHDSGITFFPRLGSGDPENNQVYNNVLQNNYQHNMQVTTISTEEDRDLSHIPFILNTILDCDQGANIMGCGCKGGNYWGLPSQQGFSQSCTDANENGICDTGYTIAHDTAVMIDAYPLTVPPAGCCADGDRDGDSYSSATCGGNDHDDDPLFCGSACYPDANEVCDGYDNDGDGMKDGTIGCQDMLIHKAATLPDVVADQSCVEVPATHKMYCFGGRTYDNGWYLDTIVTYDPENDMVEELATTLPTQNSRLTCSYAPSTDKVYCFGGYWQETICTAWNEYGGCISAYSIVHRQNSILEFNPSDNSLVSLSVSLPAGLDGMSSVWSTQTSTIFLFGGTSSVHSGNRDFILEFDPVGPTLTTKSAVLPTSRYNQSCVENSATGLIYCYGGYGATGALDEILEYNPTADTINPMASTFGSAVKGPSCVEDSVDHIIYCLGGIVSSPSYRESIIAYDPATDSVQEKSARFIQGRFGLDCVENSATNRIYCFGGSRNVVNLADIAEYTPALPALGDVDDSGTVDLADLIRTLQISTGQLPAGMYRKADIGGNRQLGMEEAVYILGRNAGL